MALLNETLGNVILVEKCTSYLVQPEIANNVMPNLNPKQFVSYKPRTMNITNPNMLKPGDAPAPDWNAHYGKAFKWGFVPKENSLDKNPKSDQIGLIAPISPDFHKWKDASADPRVQGMKEDWKNVWAKIPRYKQNQITASVNALGKRPNA